MTRDYKRAGTRRSDTKPVGAWLPFLTGLMIGLFVAFVLYLQRPAPEPPPLAAATRPAPAAEAPQTAAPTAAEPAAPEAAPAATTPAKPKFDFYTILPEMEVKVPEWELETEERREVKDEPGAGYVLQVGSFQRFEEADRVKANLALQGIPATIQPVTMNGEEKWFRVRVGPFQSFDETKGMRARLIEAGVDFMLLRIKSGDST